MIFVAVGTTDFDGLIREMDRLAPELPEPVVMQIGGGEYLPRNGEYFRFAPSLDPYYEQADMVVSHGGLGIVTEALLRGKKVIAIENPSTHGGHQTDILSELSRAGCLIWCRQLDQLSDALDESRNKEFAVYVAPGCEIHERIRDRLRVS
jgi:UDP-N-acetylglucosamine transferase subunit ALG13